MFLMLVMMLSSRQLTLILARHLAQLRRYAFRLLAGPRTTSPSIADADTSVLLGGSLCGTKKTPWERESRSTMD